jgi:exodeoxyribonuclease VII large subunit
MSEVSGHYDAKPNIPEFSVSELSNKLRRRIEDEFPFVRVRGEISGLKFHSSGHVYFDLKDDKAVLNAVIWRLTAQRLRVRPEAGAEVVCTGKITTFPGSSRYQMVVDYMELAGKGALMALVEERKKKLAAEGLFQAARKKALPFLPQVIGVITSPTGAVIRDIMHRLNERFPRHVVVWPVPVQGEYAAQAVAHAIAGFNGLSATSRVPRPDLLIVARGGGSIEDLMPFNEEIVVRAVAASAIPVISAVGHETDTTLIDLVADRRAPTPTAAAEMAVPVRSELVALTLNLQSRALRSFTRSLDDRKRHLGQLARVLPRAEQLFAAPRQRLDVASERLTHALRRNLQNHRERLVGAAAHMKPRQFSERIARCAERTRALEGRLGQAQAVRLEQLRSALDGAERVLETVSYRSVLDRGFALVRGEDGHIHRRAAAIRKGEPLSIAFADGTAAAIGTGSSVPAPPRKRPASRPKGNGDQGSLF